MTYFFPYGYAVANSATLAQTAVTASGTASLTTTILSASTLSLPPLNSGPSGSPGPSRNSASCATAFPTETSPQGPSGSIGPSGSRGTDLTACPAGSIQCTNLTPPTGYALVCIQTGSCANPICPPTLP